MVAARSKSTFVLYEYDPSLPAAVIFAVLFFLTTAVHLFQRVQTHAKYFNPFIVGGIFQIIGYIARAAAHFHQTSTTLYAIQTLLLLLAPTLYAASIYMVLARIITFVNAADLSVIPVKWLTKVFVSGDILSFLLQAAGGGIMSGGSASGMKIGQWVIVGGLCVQLIFFGAFLVASLTFHRRIARHPTAESDKATDRGRSCWPRDWRGLLFACYLVSGLILVRSVYRLVEFAQGNNGYVISHEAFLYVLDATMMFLVMVVMNLFHPSVVLQREVRHHRVGSEEVGLQLEGRGSRESA
ncbi:RTA1-domain-containing protein [Aspergillus japonicus CBS 114.51]|uniref:RTA1-domain-containing protein n=2 Tax=Aspergillus TaxID=5052 RepID=A0A2V5H0C9_ASPV1|nr:RTA1-domain-containing protein [Aspergillus japonicus CBS 114.51]PYI17349.1 RTA1-domain-containing protein [Aspergillus violaceofuscus CBS 115571]RAH80379.1 RTA1-domain-containing protein [Aspergillus japonicus CBS 114.51]